MQAEHYHAQRTELIRAIRSHGATGDELVPACPGWTVADVVRHLLGLVDNWLTGDLEVYASPEWTKRQVAAWSEHELESLFDVWTERCETFAPMLGRFAERDDLHDTITTIVGPRGTDTFGLGILVDLTQHCHDVASALDLELRDPIGTVPMLTTFLTKAVSAGWKKNELLPIRVVSTDHGEIGQLGRGEPAHTVTASTLDLFRSYGGRRTISQIAALSWSPSPPDRSLLAGLVVPFFGLPENEVEPLVSTSPHPAD